MSEHVHQVLVEYAGWPIKYRPACKCGWQARLTFGTIQDASQQGRREHLV